MLKTRVLTALALVAAVLAALFLLPPRGWGLVTLAIIALAAYEWARLVRFAGGGCLAFVGIAVAVGLALLTPSAGFARGWPANLVLASCGVAAIFWIALAPPWVIAGWPTRARVVMAIVGLVVLLGAWMALVELQARSPWLVLAAMAIVWIADTAAYFTGRKFGRRKLAPAVSPGKSWEGVYGAWVAVAIYAALLVPFAGAAGFRLPATGLAIAAWIVFVVVLASVSVIGDLFESLLKRHAGVKDSGTLLPGHGGVLDRTDALLAAMPIAAVAAQAFLNKS
ncbi:MAG: phosphatidate cytidylyltransferase [Burkholderiales bacterium]|nr:phosphatidate cytidylyltransferase [Burkholderiales bacterium]